jgi:hypothetical protein
MSGGARKKLKNAWASQVGTGLEQQGGAWHYPSLRVYSEQRKKGFRVSDAIDWKGGGHTHVRLRQLNVRQKLKP